MLPRRLLLAAGLLFLSVLGACTFPGSVKPAVKLGLSAPFEGLYRDLGYEVLYGVRLAVRERNEAGGLCGRYLVELVALNDFNEPAEAVWQARELAVDPGVMGVVGGWSPATARAAYPEYRALAVPFRAPLPSPETGDGQTQRLGEEAARLVAEELGARRVAVISGANEDDLALAAGFEAALARLGGTVVSQTVALAGESAPALAGVHPDAVFVAAGAAQAAEWILQLREGEYRGRIVGGPGLGSQLVPEIAGQAAEGLLYVSPYAPVPDDAAFVEAYKALSGGVPPGPAGAWAYGAARELLDQIEASAISGSRSRSCVITRRTEIPGSGYTPDEGPIYVYAVRDGDVFQQP
jgi:branched-chain amino acid transport system substrate-binding protein